MTEYPLKTVAPASTGRQSTAPPPQAICWTYMAAVSVTSFRFPLLQKTGMLTLTLAGMGNEQGLYGAGLVQQVHVVGSPVT